MINCTEKNAGEKLPIGVMTPIPQYPLYSAIIHQLNMHQVGICKKFYSIFP